MKDRLICILSLCILSLSVMAQTSGLEYHPFAEEGKKWETQVGGIKENVYIHQIEGDTIIGGRDWKKVYNSCGFSRKSYYAAIREEGKKVYAIAKGSNRSRLLYDFSLKAGDRVRCGVEGNGFCCLLEKDEKEDSLLGFPLKAYLKVERIDTIKYYNDKMFRRFTLSVLDAFQEEFFNDEGAVRCNIIWLEGVGSGAGPFCPWMALPSRRFSRLECFVEKQFLLGTDVFSDDEYPSVVSTPQSVKKGKTSLYGLQGHQLPQAPQRGVYIQNGKKVAIK